MRVLVRFLFHLIDHVYHWRYQSELVGEMLMIGSVEYEGEERIFEDGTVVRDGDLIGTFHVNNRLIEKTNDVSATTTGAALELRRLFRRSLEQLAAMAVRDQQYSKIQVYRGVSWLPRRGRQLGFFTESISDGSRKTLTILFSRLMLFGMSPARGDKKSQKIDLTTYWLTRNQLLKRHLPANTEKIEDEG
jgi:hypothetical protein